MLGHAGAIANTPGPFLHQRAGRTNPAFAGDRETYRPVFARIEGVRLVAGIEVELILAH